MDNLVLFGAGRNAKDAYLKFINDGIKPVCFCDSDPEKYYQKMSLCGELQILPVEKVLSQYPEASFFITPNAPSKFEIIEKLVSNNISENRILNYESTEKRLGCVFSERVLQLNDSDFFFCCVEGNNFNRPYAKVDMQMGIEDILSTYENFYQETKQNIIENGRNGLCQGCPEIREGLYPITRRLETFAFLSGYICQLNCVYCRRPKFLSLEQRNQNTKKTLDFIQLLKTSKIIDDSTKMIICNGEITINPLESEIFDALAENPLNILTNGIKYSINIEKALKQGRSFVLLSLDSGTKETFNLVKGVQENSCFERVCENVRTYASHGHVELKYIFLPGINDNIQDIDNFLDFACEAKVSIVLSRDVYNFDKFDKSIERLLPMITYFAAGARKRKVNVTVMQYFCTGQYKSLIAKALE